MTVPVILLILGGLMIYSGFAGTDPREELVAALGGRTRRRSRRKRRG